MQCSLLLVNSYIPDAHNRRWWRLWSGAWRSMQLMMQMIISCRGRWLVIGLVVVRRRWWTPRPILKTIKSTSSRIQVKSSRIGGLKSLPGLVTSALISCKFCQHWHIHSLFGADTLLKRKTPQVVLRVTLFCPVFYHTYVLHGEAGEAL